MTSVQAVYYTLTGVWLLAHMISFMWGSPGQRSLSGRRRSWQRPLVFTGLDLGFATNLEIFCRLGVIVAGRAVVCIPCW